MAATLTLEFGNTSENIYAGMDDYFKSYSAPIYTWFETAQRAFERGNIWQNMGGLRMTYLVVYIILSLSSNQSLRNLLENLTFQ